MVNSVSFADGKKYYDNKTTYRQLRAASDALCREYHLHVIETKVHGRGKPYAGWQNQQTRQTAWRDRIRSDIDGVVPMANTLDDFLALMRQKGYVINTGRKHWTFWIKGMERNARIGSLGEGYQAEDIIRRMEEHGYVRTRSNKTKTYHIRRFRVNTPLADILLRSSIKGLRGIYFKYMYMFGFIKKRAPVSRAALRRRYSDVRRLQAYAKQGLYIARNNLSSIEDVHQKASELEESIAALREKRSRARKVGKHISNPETKADFADQNAAYTEELRKLRADLRLCKGIIENHPEVKKEVDALDAEIENERQNEMGKKRSAPER